MHKIGTATGVLDLVEQLNTFLTSGGSAFGQSRRGVGTGKMVDYRGWPASRAERITARSVTSTLFEVEGSLSGKLGSVFAGGRFESDFVSFTLAEGAVPFQAGDELSVQTAPPWVALRASAATGYIWRAPGNDGAQAIYTGVLPPASGSFLQVNGFTGYVDAAAFNAQPGRPSGNGFTCGLALSDGEMQFWFVADGRRVIVIVKPAASVYQAAYLGFADTFVDRVSYPYPLVVGSTALGDVAYTDTSYKNITFVRSVHEQMLLRTPPGASLRSDGWGAYTVNNQGTGGCLIHPHANDAGGLVSTGISLLRRNLDGSVLLLPVTLRSNSTKHSLAQLAGIHVVPGSGLEAEALLEFDGLQHLVVHNVARASNSDFFTVALD